MPPKIVRKFRGTVWASSYILSKKVSKLRIHHHFGYSRGSFWSLLAGLLLEMNSKLLDNSPILPYWISNYLTGFIELSIWFLLLGAILFLNDYSNSNIWKLIVLALVTNNGNNTSLIKRIMYGYIFRIKNQTN